MWTSWLAIITPLRPSPLPVSRPSSISLSSLLLSFSPAPVPCNTYTSGLRTRGLASESVTPPRSASSPRPQTAQSPGDGDWSKHRIARTNQHPISSGTTSSIAHSARRAWGGFGKWVSHGPNICAKATLLRRTFSLPEEKRSRSNSPSARYSIFVWGSPWLTRCSSRL